MKVVKVLIALMVFVGVTGSHVVSAHAMTADTLLQELLDADLDSDMVAEFSPPNLN